MNCRLLVQIILLQILYCLQKGLDATVDIMSFIRGKNMNIYNVFLESPRINAIVTKEGFANWDIVKEDEAKNRYLISK